MQILKIDRNYPILGYVFFIYLFSFLTLFIVTLLTCYREAILCFVSDYNIMLRVSFGGALASASVITNLLLIRKAGLLGGTALSSSISVIFGLFITIYNNGLPLINNPILKITICSLFMVVGGFLCNYKATKENSDNNVFDIKNIFLLLLIIIFSNGYVYGTSIGIKNDINPLIITLFLSFGAFLFTFIFCSIYFTKNRIWRNIFCVNLKKTPIYLSLFSAICHYGGNFLSILCMPIITSTISFLIGRLSNLLTCFWGIVHGEYKDANLRMKKQIILGISLYIVGFLLIVIWIY